MLTAYILAQVCIFIEICVFLYFTAIFFFALDTQNTPSQRLLDKNGPIETH